MVSTHISNPPKPGLLILPAELRNIIYRMLLTNSYAYQHDTVKYAPLHPAILRSCRQINEEATDILHGENIWIITKINASNGPMKALLIPRASRKGAENIRYPALRIEFAFPITTEASRSYVTKITGEDGVNDFLQTLWRTSIDQKTKEKFKASSLHLTLFETPFHKKSKLQSICLEPFRLVSGLQKFTIHGQVDPACIKEILHRVKSGFLDITQILEVSQPYLDQGDNEYFAGEPRRACAQYEYGSSFLYHVLLHVKELAAPQPALTTTEFLTFMGAILTMDIHSARAHLALGDHYHAKRMGTIILEPDYLSKEARVHAALCTARAHRALGEGEDESRLFEEALNAADDKSVFLTALAELFPSAASEQTGLLVEQHSKLQSGQDIDVDVVRAFWEAV